jgi:hypothetical protein
MRVIGELTHKARIKHWGSWKSWKSWDSDKSWKSWKSHSHGC